jgi:hypothetical protein
MNEFTRNRQIFERGVVGLADIAANDDNWHFIPRGSRELNRFQRSVRSFNIQ